ncbi:MAG: hypothetical protein WBA45_16765 [Microthrixaceae bacterium]
MIYVNEHVFDTQRIDGLYETLAMTAAALERHLTPDTPPDDRELLVVDAAISYLDAVDTTHPNAFGERCDWCHGQRLSRYESSPTTCACERVLGTPPVGQKRPTKDTPTDRARWLARLGR